MAIDKYIGAWIKHTFRELTLLHDQRLAEYGITSLQFLVLAPLWTNGSMTQKEIQHQMSITPASVTGLIDTLVNKGLVIRKTDLEDSRSKRIYLTEKGKLLIPKCNLITDELEEIISQGFSQEEHDLLLSWMKKVYRNLK